jgi:hypothetical protein
MKDENNPFYNIQPILQCSCFNKCCNKRYIKVLHPIEIEEYVFSVCNETIRIKFAEENIETKWPEAEFRDVAEKYILPEISKFLGIDYYKKHCFVKTDPDAFNFYWMGRPLHLVYEMKYTDMIKLLFERRFIDYRIENSYGIMDSFKRSFTQYLQNLLKFKKFKRQHEFAERILKKMNGNQLVFWNDSEFIELAELLFNLKITKHETSK